MLGHVQGCVSPGSVNAGGEIASKFQRQRAADLVPKPFSP